MRTETTRDPRLFPIDPVVFDQGRRARREGKAYRDTPYIMPENLRSWQAGWIEEDEELQAICDLCSNVGGHEKSCLSN